MAVAMGKAYDEKIVLTKHDAEVILNRHSAVMLEQSKKKLKQIKQADAI